MAEGGVRRGIEFPFLFATQSKFTAQSFNPVNSYLHPMRSQILLQTVRAIDLSGSTIGGLELNFKLDIFQCSRRRRTLSLSVVITSGNEQHLTQQEQRGRKSHLIENRGVDSESATSFTSIPVKGRLFLPISSSLPTLAALIQASRVLLGKERDLLLFRPIIHFQ